MTKRISIILLCMLLPVSVLLAGIDKGKKNSGAYGKLFKNSKCKTVKGMITLHKMDGKVYFEFPKNLLGKKMLLGSVVESISNSGDAFVGQQSHHPVCIYFTKQDSSVQIRRANFLSITESQDAEIKNALEKNNIGAILGSFKIKAISPDNSALVFDATKFFVSGNKALDPFSPKGGFMTSTSAYKSDKSLLGDIMAFEDNISITSHLSFGVTSYFMGFLAEQDRPSTALMKRTLVLLPENMMRPRINDPRIGVFYNGHLKFSDEDNGASAVYYANRWRLEPSDVEAYKRGELVKPVKPITFYIDDKFPPKWIKYIKEGVEVWNKAYEKIGFKDAMVTLPYPKDDPEFDPNNIKYNCVKYAPITTQNSMGPSWVDPRTGEILNASVYLYHGIVDLLSEWMLIQTAATDKRVRTINIPDDLMGDAIRYIATHEMGHCLGLMHNMGASASFPVDSLRSAKFTQKYGTTPSIMDYARFNFVAQPGDFEKGVKMTPPELGVYDYYAIKWLYSPILKAKTSEEEVPVLESWISEKIKDPMYVYGKQQFYTRFDPRSQTEDLGDDHVKASEYGMKNLKYILENLNTWLKDEDKDYRFRSKICFSIVNIQFYRYFVHVMYDLGGIYQYEKYEGDPYPAYKAVPEKVQRKSLLFMLDALENLTWLHNVELEDNVSDIFGDAPSYLRKVLFPFMMRKVANIGLSEAKSYEDTYTQSECIKDVFNFVWGGSMKGKQPTANKLEMQKIMVSLLIDNSKVKAAPSGNRRALTSLSEDQLALLKIEMANRKADLTLGMLPTVCRNVNSTMNEEISGFGFQRRFAYVTPEISHIYYGWLLKCKSIIEKAMKVQTGNTRLEYEYLLLKINKALKI